MEQEAQSWLELAKGVFDLERRYGPVGRMLSRLVRRSSEPPPDGQVDYRDEMVKAALENAVERVASQELTVEQALQMVDCVGSFDDLMKLNSTWQGHWSEAASKVGIEDEERRTWWARLLAGEIQQPGTFSLRTLAVMDTLSTEEARLFTRLCSYVWNPSRPVLILPSDDSPHWKPDFTEAAILESIGLVKFDFMGGFKWAFTDAGVKDLIRQGHSIPMIMEIDKSRFQVLSTKDNIVELRCGKFLLTDIGAEIYRLTSPNYSEAYRDEIVAGWRQSYTVHQLPTPCT